MEQLSRRAALLAGIAGAAAVASPAIAPGAALAQAGSPAATMPGIELRRIRVGDVVLNVALAGQGEPVLLLHGWPQTWFEWREIMPNLAPHYRVIAPDLRGLGDSSRPAGGYDKTAIARDMHGLLRALGHGNQGVRVVGHDWGGVVAYFYAALYEPAVSRLAVLEVPMPTQPISGTLAPGAPGWWFFFHNVAQLPEELVRDREGIYLDYFFRLLEARPGAVSPTAAAEYIRAYRPPGAMHAGFEYYRAVFQDTTDAQRYANHHLLLPVLAVAGDHSFGSGAVNGVEASMKQVADHVTGVVLKDCGHWVTEEQPAELSKALLDFLS
jgi:pimeloyl-ACP methyl ester carboxylesterase